MAAGSRILIVEDSATQAARLRALLEGRGWTVRIASAAEEGLELIARERPDLVVCDGELPGMDGEELCRRLRMNVDSRGIPVMLFTAREGEEAELGGLEAGADDYLTKSADDEVLVLRVQALLRKAHAHTGVLGHGKATLRHARVLVVDDSATFRGALAGALRDDGMDVDEARDANEALASFDHAPYDCVVVDRMMPGMDGLDLCRQLVQMRRPTAGPLLVMLTGRESTEDMGESLAAGADDFIGKSNELPVVRARIRALIRRRLAQEENERILDELRRKELEALRARAEKEVAEARAALAEELAQTNRELEQTNRKLRDTQAQLVHSEKMASLGQLVAGIAHEMNNPLGFVANNVYLVQTGLDKALAGVASSLPEGSEKQIGKVQERCRDARIGLDRLADLVQKLRRFGRMETGVPGVLDLPESVDMALKFLHHKYKGRITVEVEHGARRQLYCYPGELSQVILNLLANAVDAIESQGTIGVRTTEESGCLVVRVSDTGCGIAKSDRDQIFDPFFTTKPVGSGMGLGLSIVYSVVREHHGEISVESEPGKGSEFSVCIPLDLESRLSEAAARRERPPESRHEHGVTSHA